MSAPLASAPPHASPSVVEQAHINQALDATQTAINAIDTLLALSSWTLGVLGVVLAGIAVFGWVAIRNAVKSQSEQIANTRLDSYLKSDEFKALLAKKVDESIKAKWQNAIVINGLREDPAPPHDPSPFPEA